MLAMIDPTDIQLVDAWRGGDGEAGQALFQRHFDSIYGFFETKCSTEADELTQTTAELNRGLVPEKPFLIFGQYSIGDPQ